MNLLITGASGFVGGALWRHADSLEDVQTMGVGRRPLARKNYVTADLSQSFSFDFAPDVVVHAAARSSPWGTRREFTRDNITATRRLIDFCLQRGKPRLVYISSSSVFYRDEHQHHLTETAPIGPAFINEYAKSKYAGEMLVRDYPGSWCILRPRAVFGPGDTVLFPRILKAAAAGRLPLIEPDGEPARGDLISIDNLTHYILSACRRPDVTGDFNLTNGAPVEIISFLLDVFAKLNLPRPTRRLSARRARLIAGVLESIYRALPFLGEPPITRFGVSVFAYSKTFDVSKCREVFGPPPQSQAQAVEAFVEWQRAQLSGPGRT